MNLLTDVFFFDNLKVIEESSANGTMTLEGTFQRAGQPNQNKRIYPRNVLNTQVNRLQEIIEARRLCGELDHPKNETVKLANASHLITKLWMEGDEVFGRAELLNTPAGKVAQTLVNDGVSVGISSRGLGTLSEGISSEGYKTVNDDYKLVTFDLVADPSTKGAYPTLSESLEHFNDTFRDELKDRTYITLLKQEFTNRFENTRIDENMYKGYSKKKKKKKKKKKGTVPGTPGFPPAKMSKRARSSNEDVFNALEQSIRLFITENEDHELAAQFVLENYKNIYEATVRGFEILFEAGVRKLERRLKAQKRAGDTAGALSTTTALQHRVSSRADVRAAGGEAMRYTHNTTRAEDRRVTKHTVPSVTQHTTAEPGGRPEHDPGHTWATSTQKSKPKRLTRSPSHSYGSSPKSEEPGYYSDTFKKYIPGEKGVGSPSLVTKGGAHPRGGSESAPATSKEQRRAAARSAGSGESVPTVLSRTKSRATSRRHIASRRLMGSGAAGPEAGRAQGEHPLGSRRLPPAHLSPIGPMIGSGDRRTLSKHLAAKKAAEGTLGGRIKKLLTRRR